MFAARMAYCGPAGLSLDQFLRWPRYAQDAALAWQTRESQRHRGCGLHPDDIAEGVHMHLRQCEGCARTERGSERVQAARQKGQLGSYIQVALGEPNPDCEHCMRERRQLLAD